MGHAIVFFVCWGILFGSLIISPVRKGESRLSFFSLPAPDTCVFQNLTGIPCPGCGLTRSVVSAAHGEIRESLRHHRLGLLILAYIMLQLIYRAQCILVPSSKTWPFRDESQLNRGVVILGGLLMLNWLLTLFA